MSTTLKKVGLLGGTFDPIHKGHLHVANQIMQKKQLDEVWLIPAGNPPHRQLIKILPKHRLKMCELATKGQTNIKVCDIEISKTTPCYTIDTVKALQQAHPNIEFFWILGMDAFFNIETWHQWKELLHTIHFLVVNRQDFDAPVKHDTDLVTIVPIPYHPASGTKIRASFKDFEEELPILVRDYIKEHNLL